MRKLLKWQANRILLSTALVPAVLGLGLGLALAGLAISATQASAQVLNPSVTMVQATPAAALAGQTVILTAEVSCSVDPSGGLGITFFDGANLIATAPVDSSGDASLVTSFATTGAQTITAAYNGNSNCAASSATTTIDVTVLCPYSGELPQAGARITGRSSRGLPMRPC
jgi:hypothetical protein